MQTMPRGILFLAVALLAFSPSLSSAFVTPVCLSPCLQHLPASASLPGHGAATHSFLPASSLVRSRLARPPSCLLLHAGGGGPEKPFKLRANDGRGRAEIMRIMLASAGKLEVLPPTPPPGQELQGL